jgi:ribosomal protein S18 acetylase RimI-like enzyme
VRLEVVPFESGHLDAAGELLAARHADDRAAEALLPEAFEDPTVARAAVAAVAVQPGASGASALRDGRLVGYLLGSLLLEGVQARSAWVGPAGHAVAREEDPALFRDLYAAAGQPWVAAGCFTHYLRAPVRDAPALAVWFGLGFGQEQVYAVQELTGSRAAPHRAGAGLEIRRAGPDDLDLAVELAGAIGRYQAGPPVWAPCLPEFLDQLPAAHAELLADPATSFWLALGPDGRAAGFLVLRPVEPDRGDPRSPPRCAYLEVAATRPDQRGAGVGLALTRHALAAARADGYEACATDWRATNLLASRFWPGRGFRPVSLRLRRPIDPRVAWANGRP